MSQTIAKNQGHQSGSLVDGNWWTDTTDFIIFFANAVMTRLI